MKTETIKAIFTNLLFVIGIILLIFGFVRSTLTITRIAVFPSYPLNSFEETRCNFEPIPALLPEDGRSQAKMTPEEAQTRKNMCLSSLEHERAVRKTEDIVTSLTTLIAGAILVFSFRRFIFS